MVEYGLGVDLGTTHTAAAVTVGGAVEAVRLGARRPEIPSLVFLCADGEVLIGEAAQRRGESEPTRLAREFKRRLGDPVPVQLGGTPMSAHALTARLLRHVVEVVTREQGSPPTRIVLTHPANWGPYKRDLLTQAARLADLSEVTLRTEPEAAALRFAATARVAPGEIIAMYDLGGGTFDAAVLRKSAGGFNVLGEPQGVEQLGGVDFDEAILEYVREALGAGLAGLDPADEAVTAALTRLRRECVEAKEILSFDTEVEIPVSLPALNVRVQLGRAGFEASIAPALADTVAALRRALRSAEVPPEQLRCIVLAGGSSRIPLVGSLIAAEFERPVVLDEQPELGIALGAALLSMPGGAVGAGVRLTQAAAAPADSAARASGSTRTKPAAVSAGRGPSAPSAVLAPPPAAADASSAAGAGVSSVAGAGVSPVAGGGVSSVAGAGVSPVAGAGVPPAPGAGGAAAGPFREAAPSLGRVAPLVPRRAIWPGQAAGSGQAAEPEPGSGSGLGSGAGSGSGSGSRPGSGARPGRSGVRSGSGSGVGRSGGVRSGPGAGAAPGGVGSRPGSGAGSGAGVAPGGVRSGSGVGRSGGVRSGSGAGAASGGVRSGSGGGRSGGGRSGMRSLRFYRWPAVAGLAVLLVAVTVTVAAAWSRVDGSGGGGGGSPSASSAAATPEARLAWRVPTGQPVIGSPALTADHVLLGGADGTVRAFRRIDGVAEWEQSVGAGVRVSAHDDGGAAYATTTGGDLVALDLATGSKLWRRGTGGAFDAPPAAGTRLVYAGGRNTVLYAYEIGSGHRRWRVWTDELMIQRPPVLVGDVVVAAAGDRLYGVSQGGGVLWKTTVGTSTGDPVAAGDAVCVSVQGGAVRCVRASDGRMMPRVTLAGGALTTVAGGGGVVFAAVGDGSVGAWDPDTGGLRWLYRPGGDSAGAGYPVLRAGEIDIAYPDGQLVGLAAATGAELWRYRVDDHFAAAPAGDDAGLVVAGVTGVLYGLRPPGSGPVSMLSSPSVTPVPSTMTGAPTTTATPSRDRPATTPTSSPSHSPSLPRMSPTPSPSVTPPTTKPTSPMAGSSDLRAPSIR